jgi:hypothetical protein
MNNAITNFYDELKGKLAANTILFKMFIAGTIISIGGCFLTQNNGMLLFAIPLMLCLCFSSAFFYYSIGQLKKIEENPKELTVFDSYVVGKTIKQTRFNYIYKVFVKGNDNKTFTLYVNKEDYNKLKKNEKILSIKNDLFGGFLVTEEDCKKYNFNKVVVEN